METKIKSHAAVPLPAVKEKPPFFSVIVPVYNVETYLKTCVHSLLDQERPVQAEDEEVLLEILLVDDGSTDRSGVLCDELAARFSLIKVFHKENGGLSSARNHGIERARGEYLLFVDSDDFVEKRLCARLYEAIRKYGKADAVCFDGTEHDGAGRTSIRRIPLEETRCAGSGKDYLLAHYRSRTMNVEAWLYGYRRTFLLEQNLRFREGRLHEDVEFTPRALLVCGQVLEIPDRLYHYMIRENSISTQRDKTKNIRDLTMTLKEQCEAAEQQAPELKKWMKNAALDRYLNLVQYARMDQPRYRHMLDKRFLTGKAATNWNRFRVLLCRMNVRWYCRMNDGYKWIKRRRSAGA